MGREWLLGLQTPAGGECVPVTVASYCHCSDSLALSCVLALRGRREGKDDETRSIYRLVSFSLLPVPFCLNQKVWFGLVKSSRVIGSFESMMQTVL